MANSIKKNLLNEWVAKGVAFDINYFTWVTIFVSSNLVGSDMTKTRIKNFETTLFTKILFYF